MTQAEPSTDIVEHVTATPVSGGMLSQDEIMGQIQAARMFPRSIERAQKRVLSLATLDTDTAEACTYAVPRGGTEFSGPSIRFAEILAHAWGNLRVGGRVVGATATEIIAEGVCWDQETNVAWSDESRVSIVRRDGSRYPEHLIVTSGLAARSKAQRNAVFKAVPKPLWKKVHEEIQKAARGTEATLRDRREAAIRWFDGKGIKPDQLLRLVDAPGWEDVTLDHVVEMRAIRQALMDGDVTVTELLAEVQDKPDDAPTSTLRAALDKRAKKQGDDQGNGTIHTGQGSETGKSSGTHTGGFDPTGGTTTDGIGAGESTG